MERGEVSSPFDCFYLALPCRPLCTEWLQERLHEFDHCSVCWKPILRHSLAEEFDGITTRTEGELDDRRVVLYKLGYEPPEEEVQVDPQVCVRVLERKKGREGGEREREGKSEASSHQDLANVLEHRSCTASHRTARI